MAKATPKRKTPTLIQSDADRTHPLAGSDLGIEVVGTNAVTETAGVAATLMLARRSYRTLHAELRRWVGPAGASQAVANWARTQGGGSVVAVDTGPTPELPTARDTDIEKGQIWLERPSRCYFEMNSSNYPAPWVEVLLADGRWALGSWSDEPTWERAGEPDVDAGDILNRAPMREMWDPARLIPLLTFDSPVRVECIQREALRVRAIARRPEDEDPEIWPGAEEYELVVDAERGILLRLSARLGGSEFAFQEITTVAFDEPIADSVFAPPTR